MPVLATRIAAPAAAVLIMTVAFTDPFAGTVAFTVGQVAPVMDVGRLQAMLTGPVKPPTEVSVT